MSWRERMHWRPLLVSVEADGNPDTRHLYDAAIAELDRLVGNYPTPISLMTDFNGRVVGIKDTGERAYMEHYVAWTMDNQEAQLRILRPYDV